jgi:hypothetical protein
MARRHFVFLLLVLFLLTVGLVSGQAAYTPTQAPLFDGHYWQTLSEPEKLLLVNGVVSGIENAAFAEVAIHGKAYLSECLDRYSINSTASEIVDHLNEFYQ